MPTSKNSSNDLLQHLSKMFKDDAIYKVETVQSLWSGYGEIARYYIPSLNQYCIAKHIDLKSTRTHPRGWNSDFSHQRKLSSYKNEQHFYTYLAQFCDEHCRVPKLLADQQIVNKSKESQANVFLLMEDLDAAGFNLRYASSQDVITEPCITEPCVTEQCIIWLANFHATFMQSDLGQVWSTGTYWHLATRPDEWRAMSSSRLKANAHAIDSKLNEARFQTLLHGDAKLANFCFSSEQKYVAAVDFQYTGRGCGVKDLIYLLGSSLSNDHLIDRAEHFIDMYFLTLIKALSDNVVHSKKLTSNMLHTHELKQLEIEWRGLIPFAWADFERFLQGWAPEHYKINAYTRSQTDVAINLL